MNQMFTGSILENFSLFSLCPGLLFNLFKSAPSYKSGKILITEPGSFHAGRCDNKIKQDDNLQTDFFEINDDKILYSPSPDVLLRIMNYARKGQKP